MPLNGSSHILMEDLLLLPSTDLGQSSVILTHGGNGVTSAHTISVFLKVDKGGEKKIFLCPSSNQIGKTNSNGEKKFITEESRQRTIEDIGFFTNLLRENGWEDALQNATVLQPCIQWSNVSCAFSALVGAIRATFGDRSVQSYHNLECSHNADVAKDYIDIATFIIGVTSKK